MALLTYEVTEENIGLKLVKEAYHDGTEVNMGDKFIFAWLREEVISENEISFTCVKIKYTSDFDEKYEMESKSDTYLPRLIPKK